MVTGIEIRWMSVSARPIAIGANPAGADFDVTRKMISRNMKVSTNSITKAETKEYPPGEWAP